MWDLVVIGAGPAGSAAALGALQAQPSAKVLLLDRHDFPRDKACGDGVAPHALDVLADLGAPDVSAGHAPVPDLRLGFREGPVAAGRMQRPAYVVPRAVLDARIVAAATARGAVLMRRRVGVVEDRGDWVLVDGDIRSRAVVGADGAESVVRRAVAPPAREGTVALAIRGYAPVGGGGAEPQTIVFGDAGEWPSYAWSFPIGDGRANVGYGELLRHDRPVRRADLFERLGQLLPGAALHGSAWRAARLPLSTGRPRQPDGRILLAGDALSLVNPLTGEGIFYAVLSGSIAGRVAVRAGDRRAGRAYRRELRAALGRHLRHTTVAARLARARPVVAAAVRAADRRGSVFDDIVELGLGRGLLTPRLVGGLVGGWRP